MLEMHLSLHRRDARGGTLRRDRLRLALQRRPFAGVQVQQFDATSVPLVAFVCTIRLSIRCEIGIAHLTLPAHSR